MTTDKTDSPVTAPLWSDGGDRAIKTRDSIGERHVTLATVKPPRDLRTKVRPVAEIKECSHG